eukprot:1859243-Pyramimonas_sp.AAC.1
MVVVLIAPPAVSRVSIMRGRMHVHVVRASRTTEPSLWWSRNRAIRLSGKTRIAQIAHPCGSDRHGGRKRVAM